MQSEHKSHPLTLKDAVRVQGVKQGIDLYVVFAGPLEGLWTHYGKKGSIYCPGPHDCPVGTHRAPRIFKAYAPGRYFVLNGALWRPAVLEITEHLEEQLRGRDIRGEEWFLTRKPTEGGSGPVSGAYLGQRKEADLLEPFDIRPALCRCYHVPEIVLGAVNTLPPQVLLAPAAAAPPAALTLSTPPEPRRLPQTAAEVDELVRRAGGVPEAWRQRLSEEAGKRNGNANH